MILVKYLIKSMKLPFVKTKKIKVENTKMHGLKIMHLSDLHINKKTSKKSIEELVFLCNKQNLDFVVLTGDIIDCKVKFIKEKLQILKKIEKDVYFISGNHDLVYGLKELVKILDSFIFLDNSFKTITFNDNKISLVGLSDRFSKFFFHKREEKKVLEYLKGCPNSIFLAHQPKDYNFAVTTNTPLFLCGHTHGGQIFPFNYIVRVFQPFIKGVFYKNKTTIYVNSGIGNWGLNFRYKADNEITILELC